MSRVARLGAFIFVTLAVLAAGVFLIGSKEYLFRSTYKLKAQFDNVAGLSDGADVQVGGVHSGTVLSIDLPHQPGGKVTVVMELDNATHEIIKQDSLASIETEGVLGNQYVAISFGSAGQADVKDGEMMQSLPPLIMSDLLKKTTGILDSSQQAINNATMATAHLNSVSAKIDSGVGTIGALVNDKQLYDNVQQSTATLQATMVQAQAGVTDFQENMEALKHNFLLSGFFKKRGYEDSGDLAANGIGELPQAAPVKVFTFTARQLFDTRDSPNRRIKSFSSRPAIFLRKSVWICGRRSFRRHGRRYPEGSGTHRGPGHGCSRVSCAELRIRRQPVEDAGDGQAGRLEPGLGLGIDPDSHLPGGDQHSPGQEAAGRSYDGNCLRGAGPSFSRPNTKALAAASCESAICVLREGLCSPRIFGNRLRKHSVGAI